MTDAYCSIQRHKMTLKNFFSHTTNDDEWRNGGVAPVVEVKMINIKYYHPVTYVLYTS